MRRDCEVAIFIDLPKAIAGESVLSVNLLYKQYNITLIIRHKLNDLEIKRLKLHCYSCTKTIMLRPLEITLHIALKVVAVGVVDMLLWHGGPSLIYQFLQIHISSCFVFQIRSHSSGLLTVSSSHLGMLTVSSYLNIF